jgi:sterol desaturase/sphingolipid hydroxylase (fatty acid hydroxylase superfamily)
MNIIPSAGLILGAMALISLVETAIPLHVRGRASRAHVAPNLTFTLVTFAGNALLGVPVVWGLSWLQQHDLGLLNMLRVPGWLHFAVVLLVLDLSFYVVHIGMHKLPGWWRFHAVHHSDPEVDVTTTIRQHPGETLIRYLSLTSFAFVIGASPAAFLVYRLAAALNGLLEHANVRMPLWLDRALSLVTTWPHYHKIHHSRIPAETDSNYSNLFSIWDRMFGTFTPSSRGVSVSCGLDGLDDVETQTTAGLFALPFRSNPRERAASVVQAP